MKRIIFTTFFLLQIVLSCMASGEIKWLQTTHDFGTFDEDLGNVSCVMQFVNIGDSDVVITDVRPTCGCTASRYTQTAITPRDTATISLTYNPKGRPGQFSKDVIVNTNGEPKRSVLTIKGNVIGASNTIRSKFPISIGNLKLNTLTVPFGELRKGQAKTAFIDGYNQSVDSVKINFSNVPSHITMSVIPEIVPPGGLATISVFYNTIKKNDWGLTTDKFTISVADSIAQVDVVAIINEDFSKLSDEDREKAPVIALSDTKIDFGTITEQDAPIVKHFTITNKGKSNMMIRKIYTTDDGIKIDISDSKIKKDKHATVTVTVNPKEIKDEMLNSKITILTNDPQSYRTFVRIVGEIKK